MFFSKAVSNDTFFLSIISVVDYSILVGFDEESHEIIVGIIDYMRQVREALGSWILDPVIVRCFCFCFFVAIVVVYAVFSKFLLS
jgi:hypothetical protein